jgi:hypothetical protein
VIITKKYLLRLNTHTCLLAPAREKGKSPKIKNKFAAQG